MNKNPNIRKEYRPALVIITLCLLVLIVVAAINATTNQDFLLKLGLGIVLLIVAVLLSLIEIYASVKGAQRVESRAADKLKDLSRYGFLRDGTLYRAKRNDFHVMISARYEQRFRGDPQWIEISIPIEADSETMKQMKWPKKYKFIETGLYRLVKVEKSWSFKMPKVHDIIQITDELIQLLKDNDINPVIPTEDIDTQGNVVEKNEAPYPSYPQSL